MTAKELFISVVGANPDEFNISIEDCMIAFAKMHIEHIQNLQQWKYYAGESGYIKKEEWEEILVNIK